MGQYEKLRDSLICEKNDNIDNAAHSVIEAIACHPEDSHEEAVKELVTALLPEGFDASSLPVDMADVTARAEDVVARLDVTAQDGSVEWDMNKIAEVTTAVESMMDDAGITVCHPFFTEDEDDEDDENYDEDNDGILCCLSCDRCDGCPKEEKPNA